MNKGGNRLARVEEELKREISQVINYELKNPNVTGMVSVTKVKVTPDLRFARVFVSVLNSKNLKKTIDGLKESSGFIRSRVANTVNLRTTPELVFAYDESIVYGEKIDAILNKLQQEEKDVKSKNHNQDD